MPNQSNYSNGLRKKVVQVRYSKFDKYDDLDPYEKEGIDDLVVLIESERSTLIDEIIVALDAVLINHSDQCSQTVKKTLEGFKQTP